MQNAHAGAAAASRNDYLLSPAANADYRYPADISQQHADHQFIAMLNSYRDSGGLARAQEVAALLKHRCGGDLATLAHWIVNRQVICFEWQDKIWLPLFQFKTLEMALQPGLSQVLTQLRPACNAWELANWFAKRNAWLGNRTPANRLSHDPAAVLNAARAEQPIANG